MTYIQSKYINISFKRIFLQIIIFLIEQKFSGISRNFRNFLEIFVLQVLALRKFRKISLSAIYILLWNFFPAYDYKYIIHLLEIWGCMNLFLLDPVTAEVPFGPSGPHALLFESKKILQKHFQPIIIVMTILSGIIKVLENYIGCL